MSVTAEGIRGAALRPFVDWYAATHGDAGLRRALTVLSDADRRRFNGAARGLGISIAAWYPAAVIHQVLDRLLEGMDARGRATLASQGAENTLTASLTGFVGVAFRALASPHVCALVGPQMWHAFYSGGRVRIDAQGRRCHVMEVSGWAGHHGFLCEMNNAAGRAIYRSAGCRAVTTEHAACINRDDRACVYVIRW
jgi:hypothetical protein